MLAFRNIGLRNQIPSSPALLPEDLEQGACAECWQAVEERLTATNALAGNYVWSLAYVDTMIFHEVDTGSTLDQ